MPKKNIQIPKQWLPLVETFIHRNSQINLSAIREAEDIYIKHILDSLELSKILTLEKNSTLLDL
jgi:16S rRNA G527 N7-methylase RsmG